MSITGDALAGSTEIEQRQIHQRQTDGRDNAGNYRITGHQACITDTTVTNGAGDHDAKHQRAQCIHGQVALQEALHQRRFAVALGYHANLACRREQRSTAQHQQRCQQYRRDEFTDTVDQLAGIEREEQHGCEIHQGIDQQRRPFVTGEWRNAHLEGHHGGTRRGEQRTDGQINRYREDCTRHLTQGSGESIHTAAHSGQGHHSQKRQADAGQQETECCGKQISPGGKTSTGREDDIACAEKQRKGHETEGQEVRAFQTSHKGKYHKQEIEELRGFP